MTEEAIVVSSEDVQQKENGILAKRNAKRFICTNKSIGGGVGKRIVS